uniref:Rab 11b, putative n=1 Tax=Neospora caninum (strain Liverpool) TaxID=572307 RepID=A0A0F7U939_NEOCL|nr:TPA: Rab 11b, putative [Neospora caninum Liverpool]
MAAGGSEDYDHLYKVILVGDATVGKTHLLSRYIRGTLPKSPKATIGVEFATRTVPLAVGGTIWDTAGQERYRSITSAHYRRAVGALLVYDVTRKSTFLNASKWLEELRQNSEPDIVIMMVGNKLDLVEKDPTARDVPYELAAKFAQANGLYFSEASAVTAFNVKHIFEHLLQEIYNHRTQGGEDAPGRSNGLGAYRDTTALGGVQLASAGAHYGHSQAASCCS